MYEFQNSEINKLAIPYYERRVLLQLLRYYLSLLIPLSYLLHLQLLMLGIDKT